MTGPQMKHIRESRNLTREALAMELREIFDDTTTASAINKWERGDRAIPGHIAMALLSRIPVTLPLEDLVRLIDFARENQKNPSELISEALVQMIEGESPPKTPTTTKEPD